MLKPFPLQTLWLCVLLILHLRQMEIPKIDPNMTHYTYISRKNVSKILILKSSMGQENLLTLAQLLSTRTLLIAWKHLKRLCWLNLEWIFRNVEMIIPFSVTNLIGKTFVPTKIYKCFCFMNFREVTILKFLRGNFSWIDKKFHLFKIWGCKM